MTATMMVRTTPSKTSTSLLNKENLLWQYHVTDFQMRERIRSARTTQRNLRRPLSVLVVVDHAFLIRLVQPVGSMATIKLAGKTTNNPGRVG